MGDAAVEDYGGVYALLDRVDAGFEFGDHAAGDGFVCYQGGDLGGG